MTHDYKCNLAVLNKLGITPEAVEDDTMIAAYLLDSSRSKYDLATLAQLNLGREISSEIPEGWTENQYRVTENADFTYQLAPHLRKKSKRTDSKKFIRISKCRLCRCFSKWKWRA